MDYFVRNIMPCLIYFLEDAQFQDKPLHQVSGAKVITISGIYVNGYLRTVGLPPDSAAGLNTIANCTAGVHLSISRERHPLTKKKIITLKVNCNSVFSFSNDQREKLVPCIDMADDRIRIIKTPESPTSLGPCVHYDDYCIFIEPEEKVDDFRREVDMQARVVAAANFLRLGHMVPDLIGPGLCFVGESKDPAIVTQHLRAPESVALLWKTTRDVADMIRGKVWQYSIQQLAGVAQGDDYGRNTLGKRKRNNGPVDTFLIDFGWAGCRKQAQMEESIFQQMVGFFVEFSHNNYEKASPRAKDMLLNILDIITSGRPIMMESLTYPGKLVPNWDHIRVWRQAYPATDHDFIKNKGSNCKPHRGFLPMESIQIIKRRLLHLAKKNYKPIGRFNLM